MQRAATGCLVLTLVGTAVPGFAQDGPLSPTSQFIGFGFSTSLNGNELILDLRYNGGGQREHAGAPGPARS